MEEYRREERELAAVEKEFEEECAREERARAVAADREAARKIRMFTAGYESSDENKRQRSLPIASD